MNKTDRFIDALETVIEGTTFNDEYGVNVLKSKQLRWALNNINRFATKLKLRELQIFELPKIEYDNAKIEKGFTKSHYWPAATRNNKDDENER